MQEIKLKTSDYMYEAIKNEAKKYHLTVEDFIQKIIKDRIDTFDEELERSFRQNDAILRELAGK